MNKFLLTMNYLTRNIRVSQKKGGLVFRARFEVFRDFKSKKFRRLTPIKIEFYVFSLI